MCFLLHDGIGNLSLPKIIGRSQIIFGEHQDGKQVGHLEQNPVKTKTGNKSIA
jgi:hypothetical protein